MSPSSQYKFLRQAPRDGLSTAMQPSRWQRLHIDPWLCSFLVLNALLGLTVLYSASAQDMGLVSKQAISFGLGFLVMIMIAQIPPKVFQSFSPYFYIFGVLCLAAVKVVGEVRMGAQRWIDVPGIGSVQPSEFMKLGMPMMAAWFLTRQALPPNLKTVIATLVLIVIPFVLIAEQPDLGTSLLVLGSGVFVLFLSGLSWKIIAAALAGAGGHRFRRPGAHLAHCRPVGDLRRAVASRRGRSLCHPAGDPGLSRRYTVAAPRAAGSVAADRRACRGAGLEQRTTATPRPG